MKTILIVEDDPNIADLIQLYCEQAGYRPVLVENGAEGLKQAQSLKPDCIILDVMLPEMDGVTLLKELRKTHSTPVIMVTAKSEEIDTLLGLELGADDYVTKPFSPKELMARIKAILRRSEGSTHQHEQIRLNDLNIDHDKMEVKRKNEIIPLSVLEFKLLWTMAQDPGRVFSREQLMKAIYESDSPIVFDRTIDGHIKNLRRKLKDSPKKPRYIESVFGVGYKCKTL